MSLSEAEKEEARKVFNKYDKAGKGVINAAEITSAARSLNVSPGPRPAQIEGDITFDDFCKVRQ